MASLIKKTKGSSLNNLTAYLGIRPFVQHLNIKNYGSYFEMLPKTITLGLFKKHYLVTIFLVFYFLIIAFKLISSPRPFYDWDEAIYAQSGKEMLAQHQYLTPLWQGQPWLDKPPLVPLVYGLVASIPNVIPEISTRIFTLLMSILVLGFIYNLYYRVSRNAFISALTVAITSIIPTFLQRSQVINIDVFMLLGWLGYVVFFKNYWLSLFFLIIGLLSKSLLGLYPPVIFLLLYTYKYFLKKISIEEYKKQVFKIGSQILIVSLWYVLMIVFYGNSFIQAHFIESQFKRVTASIESHFGKRTFYFDILIQEFSFFIIFSLGGLLLILKKFWNKFEENSFFLGTIFIPWFIFLNLTKTKIAWYYYPVIPQFAFLAAYSLEATKRISLKTSMVISIILVLILALYVIKLDILNSFYSNYDATYQMSVIAKSKCVGTLHVLVDSNARRDHDTLSKLNLLISTSTWWGNHASIVYYYGGLVNFIYDESKVSSTARALNQGQCIVLSEPDDQLFINNLKKLEIVTSIKPYKIYREL